MTNMSGKALGRNDPCWCGSGRKYKHCHLGREKESPIAQHELLNASKKAFSRKYCLHPNASRDNCSSKIVRAHTIQRRGGLTEIARNGHVYTLLGSNITSDNNSSRIVPQLVGLGNASTFYGFCVKHDNELFAPLEKEEIIPTSKQIFLLAYRSLCHELYLKNADSELTATQRLTDRGRPLPQQIQIQENLGHYKFGVRLAIEELLRLKTEYDHVFESDLDNYVSYYVVRLTGKPDILCNAIHQPEFDFFGRRIQNLGALDKPLSWLHFSILPTGDNGLAVFSWLRKDTRCKQFVDSLDRYNNSELSQAIVRFAFEFFENLYFSPDWWDRSKPATQEKLIERQLRGLPQFGFTHPSDCLIDDGVRAVTWQVKERLRHY